MWGLNLSIEVCEWGVRFCILFFFFFQAEDGILDRDVTGVQTCALPIFGQGEAPHLLETPALPRLHRGGAAHLRPSLHPRMAADRHESDVLPAQPPSGEADVDEDRKSVV